MFNNGLNQRFLLNCLIVRKNTITFIANKYMTKTVELKTELYCCDKCNKQSVLNQQSIFEKRHYISPSGCSGGDYWTHSYYYFECKCGRNISVNPRHILHTTRPMIDTTEHTGVSILTYDHNPKL